MKDSFFSALINVIIVIMVFLLGFGVSAYHSAKYIKEGRVIYISDKGYVCEDFKK